jgi:hypothetical protein
MAFLDFIKVLRMLFNHSCRPKWKEIKHFRLVSFQNVISSSCFLHYYSPRLISLHKTVQVGIIPGSWSVKELLLIEFGCISVTDIDYVWMIMSHTVPRNQRYWKTLLCSGLFYHSSDFAVGPYELNGVAFLRNRKRSI